MLQFFCGLLVGGFVGVFVMALLAAGRDDGQMDFGRDE